MCTSLLTEWVKIKSKIGNTMFMKFLGWSTGLLTDQMQFHALLKVILVAGDKTEQRVAAISGVLLSPRSPKQQTK